MIGGGSKLKLGWTAGKLAGRRLLGREASEKDAELGELLTSQLDQMKGLAMKLGQIVSYMDVPLPDVVQERMARLQSGTLGLSEEETQQALAVAWGAGWRKQFERFELVPIAAASIGQVHRAIYQGRDVAVKLQYPQASEGFEKDLGALGRIAGLASLASSVDGKAIVAELSKRLDEECDYEREARHQALFRELFSDDEQVVIPEVVSDLVTRTTLVSSWEEGVGVREALSFEPETRQQIASALVRFSYRSLFEFCVIQADPHPGNFLFERNGRVICLDFGCVRSFQGSYVELMRQLVRALDVGDKAAFRECVVGMGMAPRPAKFDFDHFFMVMEHLHRPLLAPSFRFTGEYVTEGLAYNGPTNPNARTMNMPPEYIWVARLQWGLWSLLSRLAARVELREFMLDVLERPIRSVLAPST